MLSWSYIFHILLLKIIKRHLIPHGYRFLTFFGRAHRGRLSKVHGSVHFIFSLLVWRFVQSIRTEIRWVRQHRRLPLLELCKVRVLICDAEGLGKSVHSMAFLRLLWSLLSHHCKILHRVIIFGRGLLHRVLEHIEFTYSVKVRSSLNRFKVLGEWETRGSYVWRQSLGCRDLLWNLGVQQQSAFTNWIHWGFGQSRPWLYSVESFRSSSRLRT